MIMLFGKQPNVHRCWEMRKKERANARLHQRSLARSHEIQLSINSAFRLSWSAARSAADRPRQSYSKFKQPKIGTAAILPVIISV